MSGRVATLSEEKFVHRSIQEELRHFVSDMYSVEEQALAQLVSAPDIAKDPGFAADLRQHYTETEGQALRIRRRLEALDGKPSAVKDAIMNLGGKSFLLFAKLQPETPGRLAAHAYSYEAMEWAGYQLLQRLAERAGDADTAAEAAAIAMEERAMMERIERRFDGAEQASHADTPADKLKDHVHKHLAEAHALESQSEKLLERARKVAHDTELERICSGHLGETKEHARLLEERLHALGGDTSWFKDAALKLGGLDWSLFFQAQSDTPIKLAAFVYAVEHLEIGGYELLKRTARRAGDAETERLCERILAEETAMARRVEGAFDNAVEATLGAVSRA